jgi:HK97 family phage portal protein
MRPAENDMKIIDRFLERRLDKMGYAPKQKTAGFMSSEIESTPWSKNVESSELTTYQDFIDAFRALPWEYAGAMAVAIAAVKPPLKVYREIERAGEIEQEEIKGEEINRLIELPNPFLSYRELIQITVINLLVPGNAFWNLVGTGINQPISDANPPAELWWIKPEEVEITSDAKKFISGYIHKTPTGKETKLDPSEIIHFKMVNPDSYFRGMGPMEAAKNSAILEFNAIAYNKSFMECDASPDGGLFNTDKDLSQEQVDRFIRHWETRHKGPKKRGRIDVTWGGLKHQQTSINPKDAQYVEMRKMNREEILATLGVPPSIVGLLEYANYSNMEIQQKKFWEDAVIPILNIIADKLTLCLAPHFNEDYWFDFDFSDIKALQEDEERKSRIAATLINNGIKTPNQIIREMFNGEGYKGGDTYYMPLSMIPVGTDGGAKKTKKLPPADIQIKREPSFWQLEVRQKVLWQDFVKRVARKERMFVDRIESYLIDQAETIVEQAKKAGAVADLSAERLFDVDDEAAGYAVKFNSHYQAALKEAGDAGMQIAQGKLYIPPEERIMKEEDKFQITPEIRARLIDLVLGSGTKIGKTTLKKIAGLIERGIAEKWTVEELTKYLWEDLKAFSATHARLIARTEAAKIENWGGLEGYKQTEYVELKGWLCSFVEDSRQAHMDAHRKYSDDPIPLNDAFEVDGEKLQYPGDPAGSAGNVCNCLCSHYPEVRNV